MFVTLVGAIETVGDGVAIQRVSWRDRRATDFGAVQGAVAADGLGNLLSGLLATVPNTTYSSSISLAEITGVAARRVGVFIGVIFCVLAFLPKVAAVVLAIPDPVLAAYGFVLIAILFVIGMRVVVQDGIDYRKAAIVGVSFWAGVGFQEGAFFTENLGPQLAPPAGERDDGGRTGRDPPHGAARTDGLAVAARRNDAERGGPARDPELPRQVLDPPQVAHGDERPPAAGVPRRRCSSCSNRRLRRPTTATGVCAS